MALIMQPLDLSYRHKKFDVKRKRSSDEISNDDERSVATPNSSSPPLAAQMDTNSNCSSDFDVFRNKRSLQDASTPVAKRRKMAEATTRKHNVTSIIGDDNISEAAIPAITVLPRISDATLRDICKYHGNMVRKFPKKERSAKDQERRNKNTIACRMSRRVKKLEHIAIEEQYKQHMDQHFKIIEESMRAAAYFNYLTQLTEGTPMEQESSSQATAKLSDSSKSSEDSIKKFSIEYLMRSDD